MEGTQPTGEFWINLLTLGVTSLHLSEPQFPNLQNSGKENSLMGLLGYGETVPRSPGREASWMSPASFSFPPQTFFSEGPQGRQQVRTFPAWPGPCFCTVPPASPWERCFSHGRSSLEPGAGPMTAAQTLLRGRGPVSGHYGNLGCLLLPAPSKAGSSLTFSRISEGSRGSEGPPCLSDSKAGALCSCFSTWPECTSMRVCVCVGEGGVLPIPPSTQACRKQKSQKTEQTLVG